MLIYGAALHYLTLGFPGTPYPDRFSLVGWQELGKQVENIEDDLESAIGEEPFVVGMDKYNIASELAFYRTQANGAPTDDCEREGVLATTSRHLFGGNSLMYERWLEKRDVVGKTMILVDDRMDALKSRSIENHFDRVDPIQPIAIRFDNGSRRTFFYRIGYGYHLNGLSGEARARMAFASTPRAVPDRTW
jgi:dolichol-phosphate mannosyltransferase